MKMVVVCTSRPQSRNLASMERAVTYQPYQAKTILNKNKHADHWFWSRYSAYPYIGCQHGCHFCYSREEKYAHNVAPDDFAHVIKVKENAPELLHKALLRAPRDVVCTGDYQPAENTFHLSRKMLEICLELGFPVFILERSPLILRDLDLIKAIHEKARAVVVFSIISTPDAPSHTRVREMENAAPAPARRFEAMAKLAAAGIPTGTCCMPVLPGISDDNATLESVVKMTADNGGSFVMTGSLTLADQQRDYFFRVLRERFPDLVDTYEHSYPVGSYPPIGGHWQSIALRVREHCTKYGIADRMPRPIVPADPRTISKMVVERLANQAYANEIDGAPKERVWAYRKAAWAIEDVTQPIERVFAAMGRKGLASIPDVGPGMAGVVEELIKACNGAG